jgi:antitoxin PrlF
MQTSDDPAVGAFLKFLEKDILEHPDRLQSFDPEWVRSAFELVVGVEMNMDFPLPFERDGVDSTVAGIDR